MEKSSQGGEGLDRRMDEEGDREDLYESIYERLKKWGEGSLKGAGKSPTNLHKKNSGTTTSPGALRRKEKRCMKGGEG